MNKSKDRINYLKHMSEVEKRLETLKSLFKGESNNLYLQCDIESEALQIRKILELIVYASLIANKNAYIMVRKDIDKAWRAKNIIETIEKLNPLFYPVPVKVANNKQWIKFRGGFLTKSQFLILYDMCGTILHAKNPFSKVSQSCLAFHKSIPEYILKIENLLSEHLVSLVNENELLHVKTNFYAHNKSMQARFLIKNTKARRAD